MAAVEGRLLSEITFDHHDPEGRLLRQQVEKRVLNSTGLWALVAFLHRSNLKRTEDWGPPVLTLVRFRKRDGIWRKQSSMNINGVSQLDDVIGLLTDWRPLLAETGDE